MRVLVLHLDADSMAPPEIEDSILTAKQIGETLTKRGHLVKLAPFEPDYARFAERVAKAEPDIVFNMVEHALGQDQLSAVAPAYLEQMGLRYTGGGPAAIVATCDKPFAKEIMRAAGLPTPDWATGPHWKGLNPRRKYIVKSSTEDASLGLDDGAVVIGADVPIRARKCAQDYGGRWFAEAYVDGREFNISIMEDDGKLRVLPIAEIEFVDWKPNKPRIVGYACKWDDDSEESKGSVRTFGLEKENPELAAELIRLTRESFKLFGNRGFARVDFRVDRKGNPLILEVNPNPSLDWDAGFAAACAKVGYDYGDTLEKIIDAALK
ncbi:MAG: D-alanine--D-alanine ligase [Proteobacteria bacterium]|nr:D-alanine--D-alanine ligase [Pseudomonadota bacterium]